MAIRVLEKIEFYDSGPVYFVVGPEQAMDQLDRLVRDKRFVPEAVEHVQVGAWPVPQEVLDRECVRSGYCVQIYAIDREPEIRRPSLLDVLSDDARMNLYSARRWCEPIGRIICIGGEDVYPKLVALKHLARLGMLLPSSRSAMIRSVDVDQRLYPSGVHAGIQAEMHIEFEESAPAQLRAVWEHIWCLDHPSLSIVAQELVPAPNKLPRASIVVSMRSVDQELRLSLEADVRKAADRLCVDVDVHWVLYLPQAS